MPLNFNGLKLKLHNILQYPVLVPYFVFSFFFFLFFFTSHVCFYCYSLFGFPLTSTSAHEVGVILEEDQNERRFETRLSQKQKKTFPTSTLLYFLRFQSSSTFRIFQLLFFLFPFTTLQTKGVLAWACLEPASGRRKEHFHIKFTRYTFINNKYTISSAYYSQCNAMRSTRFGNVAFDCWANASGGERVTRLSLSL